MRRMMQKKKKKVKRRGEWYERGKFFYSRLLLNSQFPEIVNTGGTTFGNRPSLMLLLYHSKMKTTWCALGGEQQSN